MVADLLSMHKSVFCDGSTWKVKPHSPFKESAADPYLSEGACVLPNCWKCTSLLLRSCRLRSTFFSQDRSQLPATFSFAVQDAMDVPALVYCRWLPESVVWSIKSSLLVVMLPGTDFPKVVFELLKLSAPREKTAQLLHSDVEEQSCKVGLLSISQ